MPSWRGDGVMAGRSIWEGCVVDVDRGMRVCGQSVSAPPWRSRRRRVVHICRAEGVLRNAKRDEDVRSALPGTSAEHAVISEKIYGVVQRMRLYWDFASSAVRARPEGAGRRAQVRLQGPASVCGARLGCVRSLRRPSPPADSRKIRPDRANLLTGGISGSRAGHHGCFGTPSCKARRGRSADHGATSC